VRHVSPSRTVGAPLQIMRAAAKESRRILCLTFGAVLSISVLACPLLAQTTIGTGSIVGSVSDSSGAVIRGAKVTISNVATGRVIDLTTNSSGAFTSGALIPGNYITQISAKSFSPVAVSATVLLGNTARINATLKSGKKRQPSK